MIPCRVKPLAKYHIKVYNRFIRNICTYPIERRNSQMVISELTTRPTDEEAHARECLRRAAVAQLEQLIDLITTAYGRGLSISLSDADIKSLSPPS